MSTFPFLFSFVLFFLFVNFFVSLIPNSSFFLRCSLILTINNKRIMCKTPSATLSPALLETYSRLLVDNNPHGIRNVVGNVQISVYGRMKGQSVHPSDSSHPIPSHPIPSHLILPHLTSSYPSLSSWSYFERFFVLCF